MRRPHARCASSCVARDSFRPRSRPRTTVTRKGSSARIFPQRRSRSSRACSRHSRVPGCRSTRRSPPSPSRRTTPGQRRCSPACAPRLPRASRSPARWRAGRGRFPSSIADSSPSVRRPAGFPTCSRAWPIIWRRARSCGRNSRWPSSTPRSSLPSRSRSSRFFWLTSCRRSSPSTSRAGRRCRGSRRR